MSKSSKRKRSRALKKESKILVVKQISQLPPEPSISLAPTKVSWLKKLVSSRYVAWIRHPVKFVWWLIGAFVIIISAVGAFPKVSLDVGTTLNDRNMLERRFTLNNEGYSTIYNVYAHMKWMAEPSEGNAGYVIWLIDTNALPYLAPSGKHSFYFANYLHLNPPSGALIQVDVVYRPVKFLKKTFTNSFKFRAQKCEDGRYNIFPFDDPIVNFDNYSNTNKAIIINSTNLLQYYFTTNPPS